jgi:hypothetical protein
LQEVLIIPCLLLLLSFIWMQLVRGETRKKIQIVYLSTFLNQAKRKSRLS